jgi:hypothetical protein
MSLNVNVSIPFHLKDSVHGSPYSTVISNEISKYQDRDFQAPEEDSDFSLPDKSRDRLRRTVGNIDAVEYRDGESPYATAIENNDDFKGSRATSKHRRQTSVDDSRERRFEGKREITMRIAPAFGEGINAAVKGIFDRTMEHLEPFISGRHDAWYPLRRQ